MESTRMAHYFGQPMGALVVADGEAICDRALRLLEIEWEELSFILDWDDEAIKRKRHPSEFGSDNEYAQNKQGN